MSSRAERWMYRLPVWAQNLGLTAYGLNLYRRRYGKEHRDWLRRLLQSQWLDAEEIAANQLQALQEIVDYAFLHVPHYREVYGRAGYEIGAIRSLQDFEQLPLLDKEPVRVDPLSLVSEQYEPRSLYREITSGSTGTPLSLYKDKSTLQRNWAFFSRVRDWFELPMRSKKATLWGRHILPFDHPKPPFWRHDYFTPNHIFSVYHLSPENSPHYVRKMAELQPVEVMAYPSAVTELARAILEQGETRIRPKVIFTSGETLIAEDREIIERAFGCKVRDQYGQAENAAWISQCPEGVYHNHPEYGYVETLSGGRPVTNQPGELLATGFINRAMPYIRYQVGDSAVLGSSSERCACGRAMPIVHELLGRTDDVLFTPEGRAIGRLSPVFKDLPNVQEGQIVQDEPDHLTLRLVAAGSVEEAQQILRGRVEETFGPKMRVDFELLDEIPRTKAGKFRYQLNLLRRDPPRSGTSTRP